MRPLPGLPMFTRAEARSSGWSDSALSRAVRSGRLVQVRRGYFTPSGSLDERIAVIAANRDVAGSVVSHRSALLLHDLPIVGPHSRLPELTVPPNGRGSARAVYLHRATLCQNEIVLIGETPVTSVARSVIDVARYRPTSVGVAAIDAALHRKLTTPDELDQTLLRCWNWPGIRRALRAVRLSNGRAESPLESVSRLVIGWLRLPAPEINPLALDQYGYPAGRLDFYWDEFGVAGEADGRSKYDARRILTDEKDRQEHLEDHSLVFVRWGWDQAVYRPQLLRTRLYSGFERGLARDRSGSPRLWSISRPKSGSSEENVIGRPSNRAAARKR
jgi:hypothetical protein